jgi:hypothetical protein
MISKITRGYHINKASCNRTEDILFGTSNFVATLAYCPNEIHKCWLTSLMRPQLNNKEM